MLHHALPVQELARLLYNLRFILSQDYTYSPAVKSPAAVILAQLVAGFRIGFAPTDSHRTRRKNFEFEIPYCK